MKVFPTCFEHSAWHITIGALHDSCEHYYLPLTWLNPNIFSGFSSEILPLQSFPPQVPPSPSPNSKPGAPPYNLRASGSYPDYRPYWVQYNIFIPLHDWTNVDPVYIFCYSNSIMGSTNFKSPRNKMISRFIHLPYLINMYWVSSQALQLQ